jgi:hypothetical protein
LQKNEKKTGQAESASIIAFNQIINKKMIGILDNFSKVNNIAPRRGVSSLSNF